jgi:hypothetical protein
MRLQYLIIPFLHPQQDGSPLQGVSGLGFRIFRYADKYFQSSIFNLQLPDWYKYCTRKTMERYIPAIMIFKSFQKRVILC